MAKPISSNAQGKKPESKSAVPLSEAEPGGDESIQTVEMENATLSKIARPLAAKPDLTLTINRSDIQETLMGETTLEAHSKGGSCQAQGELAVLREPAATRVAFDSGFEIRCPERNRGRVNYARRPLHRIAP